MSHADTIAFQLRSVDLFRGFDETQLGLLAGMSQIRTYESGKTLFLRGEPATSMFVVSSGKVRLSVASADGHDLTLRHVGRGGLFGEIALLDGGLRSADAVTLQQSVLVTISRSGFQSIVDHSHDMARALIKGLCSRLRDTTDQLEAIALLPLDQRLARLLIGLAKVAGPASRSVSLALDMSQGEMAALVAGSRPKVNQLLVAWHAAGIAVRSAKGLTLDTVKLREIIVDEPNG